MYTRRHVFALGMCLQLLASSFIESHFIEKVVIAASAIALVAVLISYLFHKELVHQRRYFFILGLGLSSLISLHRAQRIGILMHGPSYYLQHAPKLKLARRYRNTIFSRNNRHRDLPESDLAKSLLPPTEGLLLAAERVEAEIGTSTTDREFLDALGSHFMTEKTLTPSALYANSVVTPFVDVEVDRSKDSSNKVDIILILFNGILGEFIEARPFDSMFEVNSTFEMEWKHTLERLSVQAGNSESVNHLILDQVWSLDALSSVQRNMSGLFDATSVDDASGKCTYRALRYRPPFGSLDSVGTLASSSIGWLRRMSKIHRLLKDELQLNPKYIFVGYSRGALLALDVLARGSRRKDAHPWIADVNAAVALGGPLWGAESADFASLPGHIFFDLLEPIRAFARKLDYGHEGDAGSMGHAQEILQNSYQFLKLGFDLASVDQTAKSKEAKEAELLFKKECGDAGVPLPSLSIVTDGLQKILFQNFDLMSPVGKSLLLTIIVLLWDICILLSHLALLLTINSLLCFFFLSHRILYCRSILPQHKEGQNFCRWYARRCERLDHKSKIRLVAQFNESFT